MTIDNRDNDDNGDLKWKRRPIASLGGAKDGLWQLNDAMGRRFHSKLQKFQFIFL